MKKFILVPFLLLLIATPGWCDFIVDSGAGTLNGTDVGAVDTYTGFSTNSLANSEPVTETEWVNSVLAPTTLTFVAKDEEDIPYYTTSTTSGGGLSAGIFAFEMTGSEEYFLIKNSTYWALFQNLASLNFGVFDSSALPAGMNLPTSGYTISHISQFDSGIPVPEPMSLLVFGTGLAGLVGIARSRRREED